MWEHITVYKCDVCKQDIKPECAIAIQLGFGVGYVWGNGISVWGGGMDNFHACSKKCYVELIKEKTRITVKKCEKCGGTMVRDYLKDDSKYEHCCPRNDNAAPE